MFGYLRTDDPYLYKKDEVLFNSLYCGICKSIGKTCGQKARLCLTYDIAFFSAIAHNILGVDVTIKKKRCITHWFKRRPIADRDNLTDLLADINVLLAYYKVEDDIIDQGKGKLKKSILKKGFKKASKRNKEISDIIKTQYELLRLEEKAKCSSIDQICEPFAIMMQKISDKVFLDKSTTDTQSLFYNIGKWIYLIDALDDFEKDKKEDNYNVFVEIHGKNSNFSSVVRNIELSYVLNSIFNSISENLKNIKFYFNTDLIENILLKGIQKKTKSVIEKGVKVER